MDLKLKSYLEKHKIKYSEYKHKPVFTVDESKKIKTKIPATHTKCLFLKDNKNQFYLVAIKADKRLDIKELRKKLDLKKLQFSSPEELKKELNLTPGSVSIFGMIYSNNVNLILDKTLYGSEATGFHPNINTSTLVLDHPNLKRFLNSLKQRPTIIEL